MKAIYARPPTEEERRTLESGKKAAEAWKVRRCQIILMSADEHLKAGAIGARVGLSDQQVRKETRYRLFGASVRIFGEVVERA